MEIPAKSWNETKGKYEDSTLPEWQKYYADLEKHEHFIKDYRFFLHRITRHLEWLRPSNTWTTVDILVAIEDELNKSQSMDAPNAPGYFRANND
jgi:hypothetical protein